MPNATRAASRRGRGNILSRPEKSSSYDHAIGRKRQMPGAWGQSPQSAPLAPVDEASNSSQSCHMPVSSHKRRFLLQGRPEWGINTPQRHYAFRIMTHLCLEHVEIHISSNRSRGESRMLVVCP
jgi:hypothetical protein